MEYHKEYEAAKGTMTSMAEDPEMMRMRQVTNVISQASYTGRGRDTDAGMTARLQGAPANSKPFVIFTLACSLNNESLLSLRYNGHFPGETGLAGVY